MRLSPTTSAKVRGFTLIELMVVVVIIAILATFAVPLFGSRIQARRLLTVTGRVADMYRTARTRALARGAAVLVVADMDTDTFQVLEGVQGTTAATAAGRVDCAALPTRGCLTNNWGNVSSGATVGTAREVDAIGDEKVGVTAKVGAGSSETSGKLGICFSPAGRTYVHRGTTWTADQWAPLSNVLALDVKSTGASSSTNRSYQVLIMPNGTARLAQ